jgi:hypothetical protein
MPDHSHPFDHLPSPQVTTSRPSNDTLHARRGIEDALREAEDGQATGNSHGSDEGSSDDDNATD